jgi:hypothetical protein
LYHNWKFDEKYSALNKVTEQVIEYYPVAIEQMPALLTQIIRVSFE